MLNREVTPSCSIVAKVMARILKGAAAGRDAQARWE